jgi:hypothetical protein
LPRSRLDGHLNLQVLVDRAEHPDQAIQREAAIIGIADA